MLKIVEPAHAAQLLPSITAAFSAALPAPGQGTRFALHEPSAAELARGVRERAARGRRAAEPGGRRPRPRRRHRRRGAARAERAPGSARGGAAAAARSR